MCRVAVSVINGIGRADSMQALVFQLFWFYLGLSDPTVHTCVSSQESGVLAGRGEDRRGVHGPGDQPG